MKRLTLFLLIGITCLLCKKEDVKKDDNSPETEQPKRGIVQGRVLDEFNKVLTRVELTIQDNGINKSKISNTGQYKFDSLQPGHYKILVKKNGYIELTEAISIASGDTLNKDFLLLPLSFN